MSKIIIDLDIPKSKDSLFDSYYCSVSFRESWNRE